MSSAQTIGDPNGKHVLDHTTHASPLQIKNFTGRTQTLRVFKAFDKNILMASQSIPQKPIISILRFS